MSELALKLIQEAKETRATRLDLGNCGLTELPDELFELTWLEELYLSHQWVNFKDGIDDTTNKKEKHIVRRNNIKDLKSIDKLINLKILVLNFNKEITEISKISKLINLIQLNLHRTSINSVSSLRFLRKLRFLEISSTEVGDLSPLKELTHLQHLRISSTKVRDLSPLEKIIGKGINVKHSGYGDGIYVERCPLSNPPIEIVQQGNEAILNYWKQIEEQGGTETINEAKLIIVGEGGTGKTTLFEKLKNPLHNPIKNPTPETHGINILEGLPLKKNFRANLWDFGGQELQYMTHQFFLTPRALYVLMMDARKESPNLSYWFKIISLLGRESDNDKAQVLLVFNKRKGTTGTPQYEDLLSHYKYDFDFKFLEVDFSENDYNWDYLKKEIETRLFKLAIQLPKQWKPIRDDLNSQSLKYPHISTQRFSEICSLHKVTQEEDQWIGSAALHKLGQLLHFQDEKGLRSRIILSPKWAVNGVYTFLEDETIKENCGRFSESEFIKILGKKNYKRDDADLILLLMTRNHFDICYKSKTGDYVAAQLLPDNKPSQYRWHPEVPKDGALQFSYQYPTMPKGLISRLIVRLSEYIERIEGVEVVWKKGAILNIEKDGQTCRVLIQEDNGDSKSSLRQIIIEVMGEPSYRKFALQKVRDEVEDLHKKWFRNIKADEMVPCCCDECRISETARPNKLEDLLKLKQKRPETICIESGDFVSIQKMLDGVYVEDEIALMNANRTISDRLKYFEQMQTLEAKIVKPVAKKEVTETQPAKKTLKIFLASSNELKAEREAFELHFGARKRKTFAYDLEVVLWEDFIDAMSATRLQNEYNNALKECDIFVMLFFSKVGMYTAEEFEKAFGHFQENGKPLIYTYFKDSSLNTGNINRRDLLSLLDFQDKLKELGHFSTHYKDENDS